MAAKPTDGYSQSDVARILGIKSSQLRRWERSGLFEPRGRFGFADLREIRNLQRLCRKLSRRQGLDGIAGLLDDLRRRTGARRPLLDLKWHWDGPGVAIEEPGGRWIAPDTRQFVLDYGLIPAARAGTLRLQIKSSNEDAAQEAERWFQRGIEIEEAGGKSDEAKAAYRNAVHLNPLAAGAWVNLGTLHYRKGDLAGAEEHYRAALRVAPGYPLALFNLGNVCEETGRTEEAARCYEAAVREQPKHADAHYNLALVYERLNEPMRAVKHWRAYLKLDPQSPWAGIARRQFQRLLDIRPGGRNRRRPSAKNASGPVLV